MLVLKVDSNDFCSVFRVDVLPKSVTFEVEKSLHRGSHTTKKVLRYTCVVGMPQKRYKSLVPCAAQHPYTISLLVC